MNWKNVLYLLRVERKSGRLVRGIKATHYREHGILAYWPYWVAAILGVLFGFVANLIAQAAYSTPEAASALGSLDSATLGFFVAVPTLVLLLSFVFTLFQQIQISGLKSTTQVMYWLPVTWQEHTLASILSNLLGFPLAIVTGFAAGLLVFAALNGLVLFGWALVTAVLMLAAAFIGSAATEIMRVIQVRFSGAVYKSSGRAAVWVRLVGILAIFAIGYLIYFSIVLGNGSAVFIQSLSSVHNTLWFVPFVWLAVGLYYLFSGGVLVGLAFLAGAVVFAAALYYLAVLLNQRFGLYEPPAIRVQTSGIYTPKAGLLGRLGFSTLEAALIRKDLRAFTRRRELMGVFIIPIVFVLISVFNSFNSASQGGPDALTTFFKAMVFLFPAGATAMLLGNSLMGEEGPAVWRIYASPISAKNLVKSKFGFLVAFSAAVLAVTSIIGVVLYQPSIELSVIVVCEGAFLVFALGAIGLAMGIRGADFTVTRRARMIRQEWALISLIACALAALAILAPIAPYVISVVAASFFTFPPLSPLVVGLLIVISGVIAAVFTAVFYNISVGYAKDLLRKAEI